MKILHCVESYYPSVSGAPEVVRQLSEHMAKMGHDVTVATRKLPNRKSLIHNGVKIVEFDVRPTSDRGMSTVTGLAGEIKKYQNYLVTSKFDVIMTYAAQQWTTDLMYEVIDQIKAKKVLVPCGFSALYDPEYKDYFDKLPKILNKFDATVYLSDVYRDIVFARNNKVKNIKIIPNGADENVFEEILSAKERNQIRKKYGVRGLAIMTIANYTGEKGHKELLRVFKLLPAGQTTLISAGTKTPGIGYYDAFKTQSEGINTSSRHKKVVMIDGTKRDEVYKLLKASDLFVFLSNVECSPLVLFEAAAAGVPFVSTTAGNSAEIAKWTEGGVVVKSYSKPNGRVSASYLSAVWQIAKLAYGKKPRARMGAAGRKAWQQKYTWQKLSVDYLNLYQELMGRKQ
jgi:L-malate glycosyltransferase